MYDSFIRTTLPVYPGASTNTFTVVAQDASGNVRTSTYRVEVPAAGLTYVYDANGNLSTKTTGSDTWAYTWNAENQLTRVTKNGAEMAIFKYDPVGRRVEKVAGGVTTTWAYDGEDILRETRGTVTTTYIHGSGIDEPLAKVDAAGNTTYLHADGLGSIVKETNSVGEVVLTRQYDAWGNLEAGADQPGYAFTGREWDPEINLYYYRARYYDPKVGRFIGEDPIRFAAGVNFYPYAANAPADFTDPSGLSAEGAARGLGDVCRFFAGRSNSAHFQDAVTADLARTPAMEDIRKKFRASKCANGRYCGAFNYSEFVTTTNVVGHTIGGFCAKVINLGQGRVLVHATNIWGRESGTRIPAIPGLPDNRGNCSVQQMLSGGNCPLQWPKSVLENSNSGFMATQKNHNIWMESLSCKCDSYGQ
jgi:RHS repeat-associated protein